jgi:hypothetical protein
MCDPTFYALVALDGYNRGKCREAVAVAQRALAVAKATRGPGHLDVANPLNNLGRFYPVLGRPAEAESHHKGALCPP